MKLREFLFIFVALSLMGCKHTPTSTSGSPAAADATVQLAEAATSISRSLGELAAIEKAAIKPSHKSLPPPTNDPTLTKLVTIDWAGPIGPFVNKLAVIAGYRVRVLGVPPAIPIIVTINAKDTCLGDILRDAGFQGGTRANIYVLPSSKTIELRYNRG